MSDSEVRAVVDDSVPVQMGWDNSDKPTFGSGGKVDKDDFYKQLEAAQNGLLENVNKAREEAAEGLLIEPKMEAEPEEQPAQEEVESDPREDEDEFDDIVPIKQNTARGRINKEIEKRKAMEREYEDKLQKEREMRIRKEAEYELMQSALTKLNAPQKALESEIDPLDPDAHRIYMSELEKMKREIAEYKHRNDAQDRENHLSQMISSQVASFMQDTPDYTDAYKFLVSKEQEKYRTMGYKDEQVDHILQEQYRSVAGNALERGQSVPEIIYRLAENMGYSSKLPQGGRTNSLANLNKNKQRSADLTREVPAVATTLRANSFDPTQMSLEEVTAKTWDNGKFQPEVFRKILEAASKKKVG